MRYYDIRIFKRGGDPNKPFRYYSSHKKDVYNPGGLMVEFDIQRFGESAPKGETWISIWGIGPKEMQQAMQDMHGMQIRMEAGMFGGLPLSKDGKKGLVLEGTIWQVLGNWQGTELRMDLIVTASPTSSTNPQPLSPINLALPWDRGVKLSTALSRCFQTLGDYPFQISISDRLINNYDSSMFCGSLTELAIELKKLSKKIIRDDNYSGVEIAMVNARAIRVFDNDIDNHPDKEAQGSDSYRSANPKRIMFTDLIGQPTWVKYGTIAIPCVMRSDIQVGDYILMPEKLQPIVQATSYSQFRDNSAFTGKFKVFSVRLLGNSRQPDANSWVTVLEASPVEGLAKS